MRRGPRGLAGLWAILLALALVAAACGTDDDEPPADVGLPGDEEEDVGDPVYGGRVVVGLEAESNSFLPGEASLASPGINVAYAIFDPLVKYDEDGEPRPYLAESLEPNDALDEWTLTLRPGVEFHDGTPLDAEALKYNFDNLLNVEGAVTAGALRDVESMDVVDELTVRYNLSAGNAAFPDLLTGMIGMPFSPAAHQQFGEDAGSNPVGTGPFVFQSWQRDNQLVVTRNDNYWQEGLPYLDEIVFRPMPDEETRVASLQTGDIDAMQSLRQSIIRQLLDNDDVRTHTFVGNNAGGAIFNTERPPVDDSRVRRALAYALDQDQLIEVLGGTGLSPAATQWFSPDSPWYSERVAEAWPNNDPERARELIEEYANDPNRSDGQAPGSPVRVEFNTPPDPSLIEMAQTYQAFWNAIGVDVQINQFEQAAHIQNAIAGDFMINIWRMGEQLDPYTTLHNSFEDPAVMPTNFTNFHDEVVAENLAILRESTDFDERYAAVEAIMMHFTEQVPNTWTAHTVTAIGANPVVRNITGWEFPDGTRGDGIPAAQVMWGFVFREDA